MGKKSEKNVTVVTYYVGVDIIGQPVYITHYLDED